MVKFYSCLFQDRSYDSINLLLTNSTSLQNCGQKHVFGHIVSSEFVNRTYEERRKEWEAEEARKAVLDLVAKYLEDPSAIVPSKKKDEASLT